MFPFPVAVVVVMSVTAWVVTARQRQLSKGGGDGLASIHRQIVWTNDTGNISAPASEAPTLICRSSQLHVIAVDDR